MFRVLYKEAPLTSKTSINPLEQGRAPAKIETGAEAATRKANSARIKKAFQDGLAFKRHAEQADDEQVENLREGIQKTDPNSNKAILDRDTAQRNAVPQKKPDSVARRRAADLELSAKSQAEAQIAEENARAQRRADMNELLHSDFYTHQAESGRSPLATPAFDRTPDPRDRFQEEPSMMASADLLDEAQFSDAESPFELSQARRKPARAFSDLELPTNVPGRDREIAHQKMVGKFENMAKDTMAVLADLQQQLDASEKGSAQEAEIKRQTAALEQRVISAREKQFYAEHADPSATAAHYESTRQLRTELRGNAEAMRVLTEVNNGRRADSWRKGKYIDASVIEGLMNDADKNIARQWSAVERGEAELENGLDQVKEHNEARVELTGAQVEALKNTTYSKIPAELKAALDVPGRSQAELEKVTDRVFAELTSVQPKTAGEKVIGFLLKESPIARELLGKLFGRVHANKEVSAILRSVSAQKARFNTANDARLSGRLAPFSAGLVGSEQLGNVFSQDTAASTRQRSRQPEVRSSSLENGAQNREQGLSQEDADRLQEVVSGADGLRSNLEGNYAERLSAKQISVQLENLQKKLDAYANTPVATSRIYEVALDTLQAARNEAGLAADLFDNEDTTRARKSVRDQIKDGNIETEWDMAREPAPLSDKVLTRVELPKTEQERMNFLMKSRQGLINVASRLNRALQEGKDLPTSTLLSVSEALDAQERNLASLVRNGFSVDKTHVAVQAAVDRVKDLLESYGLAQERAQRIDAVPSAREMNGLNGTLETLDTANWDLRNATTHGERLPSYQVRSIEAYLADGEATLESLTRARAANGPEALNLAATINRTRQLLQTNQTLDWDSVEGSPSNKARTATPELARIEKSERSFDRKMREQVDNALIEVNGTDQRIRQMMKDRKYINQLEIDNTNRLITSTEDLLATRHEIDAATGDSYAFRETAKGKEVTRATEILRRTVQTYEAVMFNKEASSYPNIAPPELPITREAIEDNDFPEITAVDDIEGLEYDEAGEADPETSEREHDLNMNLLQLQALGKGLPRDFERSNPTLAGRIHDRLDRVFRYIGGTTTGFGFGVAAVTMGASESIPFIGSLTTPALLMSVVGGLSLMLAKRHGRNERRIYEENT